MGKKRYFIALLIFLSTFAVHAQFSPEEQSQIDSLNRIVNSKASHDTSLAAAYIALSDILYVSNLDTMIPLCTKAKEIAERNLAQGPPPALEKKYLSSLASALNNIGYIYNSQGDIPKALEFLHKSLKIKEEIGEKAGIANCLNNIGYIYNSQGDIPKALEFLHKSLKIKEEIGEKSGIANSLNNIGVIYDDQGDIPKALEFFLKSLKIREEMGEKSGIANSLNNIGEIELKQGRATNALNYGMRGLEMAREIGAPELMSVNSRLLSKVAKKQGNLTTDPVLRQARYEVALEMYELHILMRDSIKNEETQKAAIRQQTKYEFEKAQLVKEQEEKEKARLEAEVKGRRDNLQYSVVLICLLVIGVIVAMLGRLALPVRMAEGIIFFSFLILFEFLLVLADPYIEGWSGGAPGIKLLFNAGIAAFIFPMHAFFESKMKKRLVKPL